jgi:hypothetical protein
VLSRADKIAVPLMPNPLLSPFFYSEILFSPSCVIDWGVLEPTGYLVVRHSEYIRLIECVQRTCRNDERRSYRKEEAAYPAVQCD